MDTHGPEVIDAIVALGYAAQTFLTYEASLMEGIQQLSNEFANVGNFMTQVWQGLNVNLPYPRLDISIVGVHLGHMPDLLNVWTGTTQALQYFNNSDLVLPVRYTRFLHDFLSELLANLYAPLEQHITFADYLINRSLFNANPNTNALTPLQISYNRILANPNLVPGLVIPNGIAVLWYLCQNIDNIIENLRDRLSASRTVLPEREELIYLELTRYNMEMAHVNPVNMRSVMDEHVRSLERVYNQHQSMLTQLQQDQLSRELDQVERNMLNDLNSRVVSDLSNLNNARAARIIQLEQMNLIESEVEQAEEPDR